MENNVYAIKCNNYEIDNTYEALKDLLITNNLLDFVKPNMVIAIKANLVAATKPDSAVITHPSLILALCKILLEMNAKVIVGDSPGGMFNEIFLNNIYNKTNMNLIKNVGANLNYDFSQEVVETNYLKIVKRLDCSSWLLKADAVINFSKMKTHGMMSLSGSVKNMFGSVPGTIKLEYHYRYPNHKDFADMLIDIQEFYKCKLHIVDSIMAMEGNGPTMGTPRFVGLLLAGKNPYNIDIVCAKLMNLDINQVPTIYQAIQRKLSVDSFEKINLNMDINPFIVTDFLNIERLETIQFYEDKSKSFFKRIIGKLAKKILLTRPNVKKKECIGCQKCFNICPAKAIKMSRKKPVINKNVCIRCFCCQEFCPVGAMKTHRTFLSKILTKKKDK